MMRDALSGAISLYISIACTTITGDIIDFILISMMMLYASRPSYGEQPTPGLMLPLVLR
jgi:hypothetical protein